MKRQIDIERLEILLKDLDEHKLIVEGSHDEKALKSLGLKDIIAINGKPLYEIAEIASNSEKPIVILTDFDEKGRYLEKKLRILLQKRKTKFNSNLRWKLMQMGKNKIEDFGTLNTSSVISLGEDDFHVKTRTNIDKVCGKSGNRCSGSNRKT